MIDLLLSIASESSVLLRRDAVAAGIDDNALSRYVHAGVLVRIRQGAYSIASVWKQASPEDQHLMVVDAVMRQYDAHVVLSHASAALLQGAPGWGLDLSNVHVTHLEGGGRIGGRVIHHHGSCRAGDVTRMNDHWITSPARTVHDIAMTAGAEATLVNASDFLHRGLTTIEELLALEPARNKWPRTLGMNVVHHLADARFESVGESRCRFLFWSQGLPAPEPQFDVFHPNGKLAGRVDFAWPEFGLLLEFDGRIKYTRYRREGESLEETILREKRREELICELTGWRIIRLTWADLADPRGTAARIRRLLARAA
ncbi:type IV toxin-antitoxin system AbiEi family antitoxin domain-containing protein [Nocardioides sp. W7]|uniref:type IV toxin-antitoxin system AbiEi family antitoxin domain-containing protein n=1 Tax=Nocardioides sp. W7 TaxID=2931390 RepID=UPI001FD4D105|nr:type IV toxin-antitoxin system AbiEi family antitoxin domain-containing protein [Nocardioides sp. W7]